MEISPPYRDVAFFRSAKFTGLDPIRAIDGASLFVFARTDQERVDFSTRRNHADGTRTREASAFLWSFTLLLLTSAGLSATDIGAVCWPASLVALKKNTFYKTKPISAEADSFHGLNGRVDVHV